MAAQKVGAQFFEGWLATDYAHNIALDIILWVGVPLGLLMICAGAWWYLRTASKTKGATQVYLFAATLPFAVHSLFEFPFAYSYFLFPMCWVFGRLNMIQSEESTPRANSLAMRGAALMVTLACGFVGAAVAIEYLQVEEDYRVMRFELRRVGTTPPGYAPPQIRYLTQLDALLNLGRLPPGAKLSSKELERLRIGSENFGWAMLQLNYAVALGIADQPAEASHQLAVLRAVYGRETYAQAADAFRALTLQHPELAAVRIP